MSIRAVSEGSTLPVPTPTSATPGPTGSASGAFGRLLDGLGKELTTGERTVRALTTGRGSALAPSDLLALQAGVYRYAEAVDLSAKLIDRTATGLKTVLQGGS